MQGVTNALLNFILVSVPEELFLTVMTLIFLKRFDMLDIRMWRHNLKWIMIPVIPVAVLINLFRYIVTIPKPTATIIDGIIFYILILLIIKKNSYNFNSKDFLRILLCIALSLIILGILENSTYPVIMFLIDKPFEYFKNNILWNFLLVFPSRIFEYIILFYLIVKQNSVIKTKLFESIICNRLYFKVVIFLAISFDILSVYLVKLIVYNKILDDKVSLLEKVLISEVTLIFPVVIIFVFVLLINDLILKQRQIQQTYENLVDQDDVMLDVED